MQRPVHRSSTFLKFYDIICCEANGCSLHIDGKRLDLRSLLEQCPEQLCRPRWSRSGGTACSSWCFPTSSPVRCPLTRRQSLQRLRAPQPTTRVIIYCMPSMRTMTYTNVMILNDLSYTIHVTHNIHSNTNTQYIHIHHPGSVVLHSVDTYHVTSSQSDPSNWSHGRRFICDNNVHYKAQVACKQPVSLATGRAISSGFPPRHALCVHWSQAFAPPKNPRDENQEVASVHFARLKYDCLKVTDSVYTTF